MKVKLSKQLTLMMANNKPKQLTKRNFHRKKNENSNKIFILQKIHSIQVMVVTIKATLKTGKDKVSGNKSGKMMASSTKESGQMIYQTDRALLGLGNKKIPTIKMTKIAGKIKKV